MRADRSLAELALERPSTARVLTRFGLDYCCDGRTSLEDACRARGLDTKTVIVFLEHEDDPVAIETFDWEAAPLADLCEHIVNEHHARLRWELPRLGELAERVVVKHERERPEFREVQAEFELLRAELEQHMNDEEQTLFPLIVSGGSLDDRPLETLLHDHDETGQRLGRLRELTDGYVTEGALCHVHRGLIEGLHSLELELHQHIHEENNILFPRAFAADVQPVAERG